MELAAAIPRNAPGWPMFLPDQTATLEVCAHPRSAGNANSWREMAMAALRSNYAWSARLAAVAWGTALGLLAVTAAPASAAMSSTATGVQNQEAVLAAGPLAPPTAVPCTYNTNLKYTGTFSGTFGVFAGIAEVEIHSDPGVTWYEGGGFNNAPNGSAGPWVAPGPKSPGNDCQSRSAIGDTNGGIALAGFRVNVQGVGAPSFVCTNEANVSGSAPGSYDRQGTAVPANNTVTFTFPKVACTSVPGGSTTITSMTFNLTSTAFVPFGTMLLGGTFS